MSRGAMGSALAVAAPPLDGEVWAAMLAGGMTLLSRHAGEINDLNVFPIPDGDTGDNLLLTLRGGVEAARAACARHGGAPALSAVTTPMGEAMLLSARGNSGVILSRFFGGIAEGLEGCDTAEPPALGEAFRCGVKAAYGAVLTPVEGTMLTVMREATDYACGMRPRDAAAFLACFVEEGRRSLERTPELLPTLARAGVVDSGGAGLLCILEGMRAVLVGELTPTAETGYAPDGGRDPDPNAFGEDSVLELGYCTELLVRLQRAKTHIPTFDTAALTRELSEMGDSIAVVLQGSLLKLHVHTFEPQRVLALAQRYGEFLKVKIENMSLQHNHLSALGGEMSAPLRVNRRGKRPLGVVAVANGEGLGEALRSMGADLILEGGQTMNPSTEDFLRAFDEVEAEAVLVFPNNANILLTARQAAALYEGEVHVVESRTLGEGYAALSMLDPEGGDPAAVAAACAEAMEGVITAEVAPVVRDAELEGGRVRRGDYAGFVGGTLLAASRDREEALRLTLDALPLGERDVCILMGGADARPDELERVAEVVRTLSPMTEVYTLMGGQAVYSYVIILE